MKIPSSRLVTLTAALVAIGFAFAPAWAQRRNAPAAQPPAEKSADPALLPDQELGGRFTVKAEDLPPPKTGRSSSSRSLVIPHQGQTPRVIEGFTTTAFMTGLEHPRRFLCCRTATCSWPNRRRAIHITAR